MRINWVEHGLEISYVNFGSAWFNLIKIGSIQNFTRV